MLKVKPNTKTSNEFIAAETRKFPKTKYIEQTNINTDIVNQNFDLLKKFFPTLERNIKADITKLQILP